MFLVDFAGNLMRSLQTSIGTFYRTSLTPTPAVGSIGDVLTYQSDGPQKREPPPQLQRFDHLIQHRTHLRGKIKPSE